MRPTAELTPREHRLRADLEALAAAVDLPARLAADPLAFPRRYTEPRDQEIAGLVAALLAFGRVSLFRPVLDAVFRHVDARGGPAALVAGFDPEIDAPAFAPLYYRWNRGVDFSLLFAALRRYYERFESLGHPFAPADADVGPGLGRLVATLRAEAVAAAPSVGVKAASFEQLPRGFRYFLTTPDDGSACKRWNMYLRWMVRPASDGIDLGLWGHVSPAALVIPLDTHVLRISRFLGLTARTDGSWRTAREVTTALARLDPADPVRFDFAIAHLGISGRCLGYRDAAVCPTCPLDRLCTAAPRA